MTDLDRIRARIRQLRQMTQANGCTEAEAMSAAEIALRLMAEHGLSEAELDRETATQPAYQRRRSVCDTLWPKVAIVCRCQVYADQTPDGRMYCYYGAPGDVMVAEYLHDLLRGAVLRSASEFRGNPEYKRRRKASTRARSMRAFQIAMVNRICRRLETLWWRRIGSDQAIHKAETSHLARLGDELARLVDLAQSRPLKRRLGRGYEGSLIAGWVAGNQVPIEPGVSAQGDVRLLR